MSATRMSIQTSRVSESTGCRIVQSETNDADESGLFSRDELRQFVDEDRNAGRRIGTILTLLFIYPLVVMTGVIWWTLPTIGH